VEPRRLITDPEQAERIDLDVRSLYAMSLGVPDLRIVDDVELPSSPSAVWPVAIHPDGNLIAIGTRQGPLRWERGQRPAVRDDPKPGPRVTFSPDGRWLTVAPAEGGLTIWDGQVTHEVVRLEPAGREAVLAVGFSPAGDALWACRKDGRIRRWAVPEFR